MSERNKEVVRRLVDEVLNAGRLDVVDELYAPRLAPAAKRWIAPFLASFPDTRMAVVDLIAEGDKVAKLWSFEATHEGEFLGMAPTGKRITWSGITIYRVSGDRVVECIWRTDALGLLQQLGAIPAAR